MNRPLKRLSQLALLIAAAVLVAACGGGDSLPPGATPLTPAPAAPDSVAPTVAITSSAAGATATGAVTFTFTFNESVGSSFSEADVTVTGGSKGTFTMVSGTVATLVVTPTPNATGTIAVSVDAAKFSDLASNANTAAASASQAYNTVAGAGGGGGGASAALITFDEVLAVQLTDFGTNGAPPVLATDPTGGTNKVLKIFKYKLPAPGSEQWAGVTVSLIHGANPALDAGSIPAIPFTASAKTMTARVYSPAVGVRVRLKVEDASNPGVSVETDALTTTANAWETLTFNFANPGLSPPVGGGATSPLDITKTYNRLSVFMDFGLGNGGGALPADRTYYIDDITFVAAAGGGGGGGGATAPTNAPTTVIPAGSITIYSDASSVAGLNMAPDWGQSNITRSEETIASNKSEKYVFGGAPFLYQGIDWTGGTTPATTIDVSAKTNLHLDLWSADIASIKISLIGNGEFAVTKTLTAGSWNSIDIDLALFTGVDKTKTIQLKLEPVSAGTLYVDNVYFSGGAGGGGATAPTNAPATLIPAGSITIYSDASSVAGLNMAPDWGQSNITRSEVTIASNKSERYVFGGAPFLYQGIDWTGGTTPATTIDVSAKTNLHLDLWSADIASIKISLIGNGEFAVTKTLTAGSWNSIDIDLALFTGVDKTKTIQLKLEPISAGTLYVDNIYFSGGGAVSCGSTAPTCAPTTSIPSGSITIYSDASSVAGLNMAPDWGQSNITRSEVTIASNKSEKYVFGGAPFLYQGIDWTGGTNPATTIDVSAKGTLHLDLWSADIASIKISLIGNGENAITKTLTAGSWNGIDIDLALYTGVDKTKTIQLKLEPISAGTLYVDNVYFWGTAASGGGGGGGVFAGGIYADDYVGSLPSTAKSTQGGDVGFFYDGRFDGAGNSYTYGGVSGTAQDPAGVHNFYFGLGLNAPAITDGYFGGYVKSPGNAPVSVATFTNLKLNVWGPDQLFKAGSFPQLKVVMQGPAAAGCGTSSGGSEVQVTFATTTQGAASIYTLPLSSFTLVAGCGGDTTVAQVLAHIAQVNVLLLGTNIQYVNKDPNNVAFTNGLNIGSIKFN